MAGDDPTREEPTESRIGSYRLVQPLGSGGMSSVFRALHTETGVEVAVKVLPRNLARNRTLLQRFLREAKSAEALEHPNIVAIYDHGVDHGRYYLVLEYVDGGDLHDRVRKNGPMPPAEALAILRAVAEGLKFAAGQGLIHRDIKPANLLLTAEGTVKIADLGLALQAQADDERVTREGTTVGTVDYMAPEQARDSRGTSERSDIYSLGCTLYFLLTGQPPFPGGDVTEKLTRHFTAPPPDLAAIRPEVPPGLASLVKKMMAKKPEHRFANHDALLAAISALKLDPSPTAAPTEILDALIDDDEAPASPTSAEGGPLYALFDDEPDNPHEDGPASDGFLPVDLSEDDRSQNRPISPAQTADVSMAELAALADDDAREERATRPHRTPSPRSPLLVAGRTTTPESATDRDDPDEVIEGAMPAQVAFPSGRAMTAEERTWLKALVIGGVGLIFAVIAFHQLYTATRTTPSADGTGPSSGEDAHVAPDSQPLAPVQTRPERSESPQVTLPVRKRVAVTKPGASPGPAPRQPWKEPSDLPNPAIPEVDYGSDVEARFRPGWAPPDASAPVEGTLVRVRRLADSHGADEKSSLGAALDVIGNGTVEIADDGPFFEEGLRLSGDNRLVRARPGFRPVVCLVAPRLEAQQQAYLDIEARSLTLVGLDLIVDAKDLPRAYQSIFLCRGGRLTLRDCTVTVVNRGGLPLSVIKTGTSDKGSRIHLERTLVRGAFTAAVELTGNGSEVVIARSAVVNGLGAAVLTSGEGTHARIISVTRSVLATRGPSFEVGDAQTLSRPPRLHLHSLGSNFTHLASPTPTSLVALRGEPTSLKDAVDWYGEANTYAGWSCWLSAGKSHSVRIAGLAAARGVWGATDSQSTVTTEVRPFRPAADHAGPSSLLELAPERADVLSRVSAPTPLIHEKTLEAFARPIVPGLTDPGGATRPVSVPPFITGPPGATSGVRILAFNADTGPFSGDLGRFVAANVSAGDRLVRVRATGTGTHPWTPTRVPDGVSLEIVVTPDSKGRFPSWVATRPATPDPIVAVRGGGLTLVGVDLLRDDRTTPLPLVRVEGGHLLVHRSRLTVRGGTQGASGAGGMIEFRAPGTEPLRTLTLGTVAWPFGVPTDRPTCRLSESILITGDAAISAEVGRGQVALAHCAVAAGGAAFALKPDPVARHRFEADLWLDHCTVAAEGSVVSLGPWTGGDPGPDRPWLVTSARSAFFGTYERRTQETVMLRADGESFARGALFWQSTGDAYEVPRFALAGDLAPPANHRPDVVRQWADLWGHAHVHRPTGPRPPTSTMTRRLVGRQLKPGDVSPGDLFIDPAFPKDDPLKDLGADLTRLGIKPATRGARPR